MMGNQTLKTISITFNELVELHLVSKMAKYRVFIVTLANEAKKWLMAMTPRAITSWQQLSTTFL